MQQSIQRRERALLETKSKVTHPVYSLYFPEEKHEWWWLYIADRRDQTLVSMPYHVCTLKDTEEVGQPTSGFWQHAGGELLASRDESLSVGSVVTFQITCYSKRTKTQIYSIFNIKLIRGIKSSHLRSSQTSAICSLFIN